VTKIGEECRRAEVSQHGGVLHEVQRIETVSTPARLKRPSG
jgi:hypothetical protein